MTDKNNRKEEMIQTAARLFIEQGYTATSTQQIADAVGCTKAALYYHFHNKRDLLQAVVEANLLDFAPMINQCEHCTSLSTFIRCFSEQMIKIGHDHIRTTARWIISEFPNFTAEEKKLVQRKHLSFTQQLQGVVQRFVPNEERAKHMAWLLECSMFGYAQIFWHLEMASTTNFSDEDFINILAEQFSDLKI